MAISRFDGGQGGASSAGWWPGLEVPADTSEMDPDAVRELARELGELWNDLTGNTPGTLEDLLAKSNVVTTSDAFGAWETGKAMAESYAAAYREMETCYGKLRDQLSQAITTLRLNADKFEDVDAMVAGSFQYDQPDPGLGTSGPGVADTPGMPA